MVELYSDQYVKVKILREFGVLRIQMHAAPRPEKQCISKAVNLTWSEKWEMTNLKTLRSSGKEASVRLEFGKCVGARSGNVVERCRIYYKEGREELEKR